MAYRGADPTAVMGGRIGAYLLDGLIMGVIVAAIGASFFFGGLQSATETDRVTCPSSSGRQPGQAVFCLDEGTAQVRYLDRDHFDSLRLRLTGVSLVLSALNNVLLQGFVGGSLGKLIVGLRVVRPDGRDAGPLRCLVRTVLLPVDSFCCAVVGLLTAFNSQGHRRVGDMAADTLVISRRDQDALIIARSGHALPDLTTLAAAAWTPPSPPATPAFGHEPEGATVVDDPPLVEPVSAPRPGVDAPTWDAARNTYIQYDPELAAWMQWSDTAGEWQPLT